MVAPLVEPAAGLSTEEVRRYSRHLIIPEVGMIGQRRLKNARVLVIGAGGLGSPALLYLAAAGVGTIGIIDDDVVEESNLQRQVIHGRSDIGRLKTESAADKITEINPFVDVKLHSERLASDNALAIMGGYDLVLDGTDNFATRYLVNDAAVLLGIPYVWGSIYRFDGQVSVFWAKEGPQYRDLHPEPPPPGSVPSCAEGGVLGVLCAAIGSAMVTEAIKLITGIGEPLIGRVLIHDALSMDWSTVTIRRDPAGSLPTKLLDDYDAFCGTVSQAASAAAVDATIDVKTLATWLDEREAGERDFVLLDVRETNEFEINRVPGSVLLPKAEILSGRALSELPQNKQLVLICKSGSRSAECLAMVKDAGHANAVHVGGGVSAWVAQIDPSQPEY